MIGPHRSLGGALAATLFAIGAAHGCSSGDPAESQAAAPEAGDRARALLDVGSALPDRAEVRDLDVPRHNLETYDALTRSDSTDPEQ